jgi:hypothetical protein
VKKVILLTLVVISILAFAVSVLAAPPFIVKQRIVYDGYLEQQVEAPGQVILWADTLFVVNNTNTTVALPVWIEVFDKHGILVAEGTLYNGGQLFPAPNYAIPLNGFGWVTLGMMVGRSTQDPYGSLAGEKFLVKISTGKGDPNIHRPTTVEVKQVLYKEVGITMPAGEAIWMSGLIRSWAETCLGGNRGPGLVKSPIGWH